MTRRRLPHRRCIALHSDMRGVRKDLSADDLRTLGLLLEQVGCLILSVQRQELARSSALTRA
jgi:hypothetical protein